MTIGDQQGIDDRRSETKGKVTNMTVEQNCGDHVMEVILGVDERISVASAKVEV